MQIFAKKRPGLKEIVIFFVIEECEDDKNWAVFY